MTKTLRNVALVALAALSLCACSVGYEGHLDQTGIGIHPHAQLGTQDFGVGGHVNAGVDKHGFSGDAGAGIGLPGGHGVHVDTGAGIE